jgi:hypothetical protein
MKDGYYTIKPAGSSALSRCRSKFYRFGFPIAK